jgi:hypothetical protein
MDRSSEPEPYPLGLGDLVGLGRPQTGERPEALQQSLLPRGSNSRDLVQR